MDLGPHFAQFTCEETLYRGVDVLVAFFEYERAGGEEINSLVQYREYRCALPGSKDPSVNETEGMRARHLDVFRPQCDVEAYGVSEGGKIGGRRLRETAAPHRIAHPRGLFLALAHTFNGRPQSFTKPAPAE